MIASAHVAAGFVSGMAAARIAKGTAVRVIVAFILGVLSHMVLDAIPHADYYGIPPSVLPWMVLGEIVVVGAIAAAIVRPRLVSGAHAALVAGLAGATLPDLKFPARVFSSGVGATVARYGDRFHELFHAAPLDNPALGWLPEILCTTGLLWALTRFPRTAGCRG